MEFCSLYGIFFFFLAFQERAVATCVTFCATFLKKVKFQVKENLSQVFSPPFCLVPVNY